MATVARTTKRQRDTLQKLDYRQVRCQSNFFHAFADDQIVEGDVKESWVLGPFGFPLASKCVICGTRRIDVWHEKTGELAWRDYQYPDFWIHWTGIGKPLVASFRTEFIRRMKELREA